MLDQLPIDPNTIKGFLADDEACALYQAALSVADIGPCLEIGSYCGKSTLFLGCACQRSQNTVFAVDHHRGSEEHQRGEGYHDPELYDATEERMDSFKVFRQTLRQAQIEDSVVPIVCDSTTASRHWATPLGMVFIDGGHSLEAAQNDYKAWAKHILPGGILAIHDLFPDPEKGGQAPITIYRQALHSGLFEELKVVNTLGLLRRRPE